MHTVYTDQVVFENGNANIACNLVHEFLIAAFNQTTIETHFFLTGMPARIIQGEASEAVTVISFGTSQDDIFSFCCSDLGKKLGASGTVILTDQAQMIYDESIFIEIWHIVPGGPLVVTNGIVMQDKLNIPEYIL